MAEENGVLCCALVLAGCDMGLEMVFLSGSMGMKYSQWPLADSTSAPTLPRSAAVQDG